jgi:hypothetical protein
MKILVLTFGVLLSATTVSFAQSLTNFGPNAPWYGESYGKPVSGTYPPLQKSGYGAYAYRPYEHAHYRHHRYRHHRYWW